jgi:hypothetical protein
MGGKHESKVRVSQLGHTLLSCFLLFFVSLICFFIPFSPSFLSCLFVSIFYFFCPIFSLLTVCLSFLFCFIPSFISVRHVFFLLNQVINRFLFLLVWLLILVDLLYVHIYFTDFFPIFSFYFPRFTCAGFGWY